MDIIELKQTAIVHQLAYYLADNIRECIATDYLTYYWQDNVCTFSPEITHYRHVTYKENVLDIPLQDFISLGAIYELYFDVGSGAELHINSISNVIAIIECYYLDFQHKLKDKNDPK